VSSKADEPRTIGREIRLYAPNTAEGIPIMNRLVRAFASVAFGLVACGGTETVGAGGAGGLPSDGGSGDGDAAAILDASREDTTGGDVADTEPAFDAGPFDCMGCICDGATHYCRVSHAGAPKRPFLPDAAACSDLASSFCIPLPESCQGTPSCSCASEAPCICQSAGGGILVECFYP
jgi:hypothetical protein